MKTYFIVFEGIDGAGKDTQLYYFSNYLRKKDKYTNLWITREPTKITSAGQIIEKKLKSEKFDKDEALKLYIQDRKEHSRLIKGFLKTSYVLSSRYDVSTFVYQSTQGFSFERIYEEHNYKEEKIIIPDLTIIYKININETLKRVFKRNSLKNEKNEFFEKRDFLIKASIKEEKVIEYMKNKMPERDIVVIDANGTIEEVSKKTIEVFEKWLKKREC